MIVQKELANNPFWAWGFARTCPDLQQADTRPLASKHTWFRKCHFKDHMNTVLYNCRDLNYLHHMIYLCLILIIFNLQVFWSFNLSSLKKKSSFMLRQSCAYLDYIIRNRNCREVWVGKHLSQRCLARCLGKEITQKMSCIIHRHFINWASLHL